MLSTQHLKPARAKAHRPYSPGHDKHHYTMLTIQGGDKGTGKPIARAYYWADRLSDPLTYGDDGKPTATRRSDLVDRITTVAAKHGYTITYWPKELRP